MDKKKLRQIVRNRRKFITKEQSIVAGEYLLMHIKSLIDSATKISIYHACYGEISLSPVIDYALANGKEVYQPIATHQSKILSFERIYTSKEFPMFAPEDYELNQEIKCYNLDLIIMPLIAIDHIGHRLGQGGGYYDATLSNLSNRPVLCGVGYQWQMFENVPTDSWDVPLDYFVSEQKIYRF